MARTQLCTSVLSRISGLCNDCTRSVTDIRIVQHAGLTADGVLGLRIIIYIGMLANHEGLNVDKLYMIPNVLTATLDRYIGGSLDPTLWLRDPMGTPLHQMVAQHREHRTMSQDIVLEFIRCMKRLLSCHADLQRNCILCKKQLPARWMIILCEGCEHTLVGGGGRDTLCLPGIEILCFLHWIVEDIHSCLFWVVFVVVVLFALFCVACLFLARATESWLGGFYCMSPVLVRSVVD